MATQQGAGQSIHPRSTH